MFDLGEDRELIAALEGFAKVKVTLNRWPDRDQAKELRDDLLPEFVEGHVEPALRRWREYLHPYCVGFVGRALEYAAQCRRRDSQVDFGDLLLRTRDLLRDHPAVRQFFAQRFTHLLVDEFQDTDPVQAEILFYLGGDDVDGGWQQRPLRPGALFVVGDPKQSIYRFRRADIGTYNRVKQCIRDGGGDVLQLDANFRSVDAIGDLVDRAFQGVFPEEASDQQAAFAPLATQRPGPEPFRGAARLVLPGAEKKDDILEVDATCVASWMRWALDGNLPVEDEGQLRPARPGDFLVLTARKAHLPALAAALEDRRIPCAVSASDGGEANPWVTAALGLLQCLADPDDPVKVVGTLVGPLFGVDYQQLLDHKQGGGGFSFLAAGNPPPDDAPVAAGLHRLHQLWRLTLGCSPTAAVSALLESVGLLPLVAASPGGAGGVGELLLLTERLRGAEGVQVASLAEAVEWLVEATRGETSPLSLLVGDPDVARVMNLHKAKGLEAPIVILAAPWQFGSFPPGCHVDRGEDGSRGYFLVTRAVGQATKRVAQPPDWEAKSETEQRYLDAERARLLYVAATRARQYLVVSQAEGKRDSTPWGPLLAFIDDEVSLEGVGFQPLPRPVRSPSAVDREEQARARGARLEQAGEPTWSRVSVTELAKRGRVTPPWSAEGKGMSWGRVVHRALESLTKGGVLSEGLLTSFLLEEERSPHEVAELQQLVTAVQRSALWQRAHAAPECYAEVPFGLPLGEGDELLEGVIDLVFREDGGWTIVDYKTDQVQGDIGTYRDFYARQLELYGRAWGELSGEPVVKRLLYFVHGDAVVEV